MTAINKSATLDIETISGQRCVRISDLLSGDSFAFLDPVYIDTTGVVKAANTQDSAGVLYDGFATAPSDSIAGQSVAIIKTGAILKWLDDSDSYIPGTLLYVGVSGGLDDAASPSGAAAVAKVISTTEIVVL